MRVSTAALLLAGLAATAAHGETAFTVDPDAGNNTFGASYDQRGSGYPRVIGSAADIGAYELDTDVIFANGFDP